MGRLAESLKRLSVKCVGEARRRGGRGRWRRLGRRASAARRHLDRAATARQGRAAAAWLLSPTRSPDSRSASSRSTRDAPPTLADVLATPVASLVREQALLTLEPGARVGDALKSLARRRVLSAPVSASQGPINGATPRFQALAGEAAAAGRGLACFVDVRDVASSFLASLAPADYGPASKLLSRVARLESVGAVLADAPLASLAVVGSDGAFLAAGAADTLTLGALLASHMAPPAPATGGPAPRATHRVALLAPGGDAVTHVLSQLDVARHVLAHAAALGPLAARTAADLGWAAGGVVSVGTDVPAIRALAAMEDAGVAGVAVVDAEGAMVGTFAYPDLRALVADHLGSLALPVAEFLARSRGREFWGVPTSASNPGTPAHTPVGTPASNGGGGPVAAAAAAAAARRASIGGRVGQEVVTATADEPFSALLARLVARRVHRLHVVDDGARPVGVVTLTDALAAVVAAAEKGAAAAHA
jgi:CBS domain-containing protein